MGDYGVIVDGFLFTNNIIWTGEYGWQTHAGPGINGLLEVALNWQVNRNILVGEVYNGAIVLPNDTIIPVEEFILEFEDYSAGDVRLKDTSQFKDWATDGTDPGANIIQIICAISTCCRLNKWLRVINIKTDLDDATEELAGIECPTQPQTPAGESPTQQPSTSASFLPYNWRVLHVLVLVAILALF